MSGLTTCRREVRSSRVGETCLTKSSSAPCGDPHAQLGVGDAARHRRAHHRLELGRHLLGGRDEVDGAEQRRGDRRAPRRRATGRRRRGSRTGTRRRSWRPRPAASAGRLALVDAVGEQDRVSLGHVGHRLEDLAGQGEPGAHRRAAVGAQPLDGPVGLAPGVRRHRHEGALVAVGVDDLGGAVARDDREERAVDDLGQGGLGGLGGGLHAAAPHRAGGVDEDDLGGRPGVGQPGRGASPRTHRSRSRARSRGRRCPRRAGTRSGTPLR